MAPKPSADQDLILAVRARAQFWLLADDEGYPCYDVHGSASVFVGVAGPHQTPRWVLVSFGSRKPPPRGFPFIQASTAEEALVGVRVMAGKLPVRAPLAKAGRPRV